MKKKFSETKVGQFLLQAAPGLLGTVGEVLPDKGVLGLVKNLIQKDPSLPPEDKEKALKLLEQDMVEMQEGSKRWDSDMKFDIDSGWIDLLKSLMITIYVSYFGSRGFEKFQTIKK